MFQREPLKPEIKTQTLPLLKKGQPPKTFRSALAVKEVNGEDRPFHSFGRS